MDTMYDVVVIGGGVVGSAVARELARYKLNVAVLEKESDVCTQTSARNTGMLHAGFLYTTGSLKAVCCVEGNKEFDKVAKELDVPFKRTGKLIVGFTEEHRERLEKFMQRGEENGVEGLTIIDRKQMDQLDESAGGIFAMHCPSSGILDPFIYTVALAENAVENGARYYLNTEVVGVEKIEEEIQLIHTTKGDFKTKWIVNCAGLNSAIVSEMLGISGYCIQGVKGEYFVLDKKAGVHAKIPVYPAPNPDNTFDIHATPTVDGNVLVGPDSVKTDDFQDYESTQKSMEDLIATGSRMFKHMKREYFIRNFAGIRPKLVDPKTGKVQDFVLERREEVPFVINLVGIESPGVTCALPLARRAVALLAKHEALEKNENFNPKRKGIIRFSEKSTNTQKVMIAKDKNYGEIVCRCECVTKAEILQAIHNPLGVSTVNGIKYRTRATMGRCQGGYCEMRITQMIMEECGKKAEEVELGYKDSTMFTGIAKSEVIV